MKFAVRVISLEKKSDKHTSQSVFCHRLLRTRVQYQVVVLNFENLKLNLPEVETSGTQTDFNWLELISNPPASVGERARHQIEKCSLIDGPLANSRQFKQIPSHIFMRAKYF